MLGAIAGDIIGSRFESQWEISEGFPLFVAGESRFTDDTVQTLAVAETLLLGKGDYAKSILDYYHRYPLQLRDRHGREYTLYGGGFKRWADAGGASRGNSYGNGCVMRVSPVSWVFNTLEATLAEAERSAVCTHNHPEALEAVRVVAAAIFLARTGQSKEQIRAYVEGCADYDYGSDAKALRTQYGSIAHVKASVPFALRAFYQGSDFEDTVRRAIHFGGDTDTNAAVAGAIAEAYYGGVPAWIVRETRALLDDQLRGVIDRFTKRFRS